MLLCTSVKKPASHSINHVSWKTTDLSIRAICLACILDSHLANHMLPDSCRLVDQANAARRMSQNMPGIRAGRERRVAAMDIAVHSTPFRSQAINSETNLKLQFTIYDNSLDPTDPSSCRIFGCIQTYVERLLDYRAVRVLCIICARTRRPIIRPVCKPTRRSP